MTTVTLYHGTSKYGAAGIKSSGIIRGGSYFGVFGPAVALTPSIKQAREYGDVVVTVTVPKSSLIVDPESRDDDDVDAAIADGASVYARGDVAIDDVEIETE